MFEYDKEVLETKVELKKLREKSYEKFVVALMLMEDDNLTIDDAADRYDAWINISAFPNLLNAMLSGEWGLEDEEEDEG